MELVALAAIITALLADTSGLTPVQKRLVWVLQNQRLDVAVPTLEILVRAITGGGHGAVDSYRGPLGAEIMIQDLSSREGHPVSREEVARFYLDLIESSTWWDGAVLPASSSVAKLNVWVARQVKAALRDPAPMMVPDPSRPRARVPLRPEMLAYPSAWATAAGWNSLYAHGNPIWRRGAWLHPITEAPMSLEEVAHLLSSRDHLHRLLKALPGILDWIESGAAGDWSRLDLDQSIRAEKRWHRSLVAAAGKPAGKPASARGEVLVQLPGGQTVQRLAPHMLREEGQLLGHCVQGGTYASRVASGLIEIFSLRDARNVPLFTIEASDTIATWLCQVKGRKNRLPGLTQADTDRLQRRGGDIMAIEEDAARRKRPLVDLQEAALVQGALVALGKHLGKHPSAIRDMLAVRDMLPATRAIAGQEGLSQQQGQPDHR